MILLFYQPFWLPWELAILALISFLGFRTISRKSFRSFGVTWISLISYPLSAILQLSIIESPISQRWFIVISGLIWLGILYAVAYYFTNSREFVGKQFLEITQAIHLITLWQILNVLNFTLIFVHLPWWQIWTVVVIAVSLLTYQLLAFHTLRKGSIWLTTFALTLTSLELFVIISLLPLHFYVQSALVALWFYFVTRLTLLGQDMNSRKKLFFTNLIFILIIGTLLILLS
jgi:hypothetical protein